MRRKRPQSKNTTRSSLAQQAPIQRVCKIPRPQPHKRETEARNGRALFTQMTAGSRKVKVEQVSEIGQEFFKSLGYLLSVILRMVQGGFRLLSIFIFAVVIVPLIYIGRILLHWMIRWMNLDGERCVLDPPQRVRRAHLVLFLLYGFSIGLAGRMYFVQGVGSSNWQKLALKQQSTEYQLNGMRGSILDRNGERLAVSIPSISVGIHPHWIKSEEHRRVASRLSLVLDEPAEEIVSKLSQDKKFVWLKRDLSIDKKEELKKLRIRGLEIERDFRRVYPQNEIASGIVGRVSRDGFGLSGVERSLETLLTPTSEEIFAKRDARGNLVPASIWETTKSDNSEEPGEIISKRENGDNIILAVDSAIQKIAEEEVDTGLLAAKARDVIALMMDADSGEVLVMAQSNRFDPNDVKNITPESLRNVSIQSSYEPGSTLKPLVAAIALDRGLVGANEMIDCENGRLKVGRNLIRDAHPIATVSFQDVLVQSSNIGMAKLGFRLGKEALYSALLDFGFGKYTGVGMSGEAKGILRKPSRWATVDVATHSFGQGLTVTPIQLARAYSSLANGGYLVKPQILKVKDSEIEKTRIMSADTAMKIKEALRLVVESPKGTGKNARIKGVPVYGKTGTAQKANTDGRGYDPSKVFSSFIGFVDGTEIGIDKRLVLYVAVDEPGVFPRWGGTVAAPVFKQIVERTLSYLLAQENIVKTTQLVKANAAEVRYPAL